MSKITVMSAFAVCTLAGVATAAVTSANGLNFNSYESFRNPAAVIASVATLDGVAAAVAFNGSSAATLGDHTFREQYPALTQGFANRHMLWLSTDGGATPYQFAANEGSFRLEACFRTRTNHPTGIGAPVNSETGIWIHNPRVNEQGVPFIDEGGIWAITNGTSFIGGASQDFFLFGEGGFNNPGRPPISIAGDLIFQSYTYYAADYFAPGSRASFEATVTNVTTGFSRSSGLLNFNAIPGSGENGLNAGATIGFRFQNQVFQPIDTDTTVELSHVRLIPAPGAAALLGLGGLIAGRRRRA